MKKNIDLKIHTKHEVLAMIDREKMWQVIYNLTDNAIKYTPDGGMVSLFVFNEGDNCRIEVEDNGIGIPEGDTEQVFDRFYRVDKARSRASGGTGLGLSIVKETVLLHGGIVYCESKENQGSKFTVILLVGNCMPLVFFAARTRSLASLTAASGSPTISKAGSPLEI